MLNISRRDQDITLGDDGDDEEKGYKEVGSKLNESEQFIQIDNELNNFNKDGLEYKQFDEEIEGNLQYQDSQNGTFTGGTHWFFKLFFYHLIKMNIRLNSLLRLNNHLKFRDIPNVQKEIKVEENSRQISEKINEQCIKNDGPLTQFQFFKIILNSYLNKFLKIYFLFLGDALSKVISTIVLQNLIKNIQIQENVFQSALSFIGLQVFSIIITHRGGSNCQELSTQIRMCLISTLFKKINSLSYYSIKSANLSKCFNLISTNLQQIEAKFPFYFLSLISPISLIISAIILYQRHGYVGIITILVLIGMIPIQNSISKKATFYLTKKTRFSDKRISITNQILEGIKLVKLYAWEKAFQKFVEIARSEEAKEHVKFTALNLISLTMTSCSAIAGSFFAFFISYYFSNSSGENNFDLSSAKMYSTISLLLYIRVESLLFLQYGLNLFHEQQVFAIRYLNIINIENTDMKSIEQQNDNNHQNKSVFTNYSDQSKINKIFTESIENKELENLQNVNETKVKLTNYTVWWSEDAKYDPVISNINLDLKPGSFNAIIGKVGSGKTSLLYSLIKETPLYSGEFKLKGTIAFCGQEPCIIEDTVKENILFGKPYHKQWYDKVVQDCQLLTDFELLQFGDLTEIGDKGVNLSGGQKSRIALARAVYSNADIYVLDDPLSAVDSKVAKQLIQTVFKQTLKGKMIIMSTHQTSFVYQFDNLIIMEKGTIIGQGNPYELQDQLKEFQTESYSLEEQKQTPIQQEKLTLEEIEDKINKETQQQNEQNNNYEITQNKKKQQKQQQNSRKIIKSEYEPISFNIYKRYLSRVKKYKIIVIAILYALGDVILFLFNRIVSYFDDITFDRNSLFLLLGVLTISFICLQWKRLTIMYNTVNSCNDQIHNNMLSGLLNTSISYFETRSKGSILNRFTNDLGSLDFLNSQISDVLERVISLFSYLVLIIVAQPYFIVIGLLQWYVLIKLLKYSSRLIQHSKSLYSKSKSPVFSFFSSVLSSMEIIRAYKQNHFYQQKFDQICNLNIRCNLLFFNQTRIFTLLIQYTTLFTSISGLIMIINFSDRNSGMLSQSILCIYLMSDIMAWSLRQMVNMENTMSSVQSILEIVDLKNEEDQMNHKAMTSPTPQWPTSGAVEFNNVYLRYKKESDFSLKGINFQILPNEKVGCIGRTGAGKSSLIEALFRMRDQENKENVIINDRIEDSSISFDGIDIHSIPLFMLRSNICIIPQVPFVFTGSIRRNIDPLQEYSDEDIINVLKEVNLYEVVMNCQEQLETDMTDVNAVFSVGQKQLICLARALLKKSQLVIMDEATSNIDSVTDQLIQNTIQKKMKDCSVLTIAHRLNTIANYDKIIVLDKGRVVECNHPYLLLVNDLKDQHITSNSLFATYTRHSGEENSKIIFEIAKNNYLSKQS